ncbi:hypothetical protein IFM89_031583 [Coptis chinensis]|uniref:Glycerol-3-phosphate acyltransferase RAM2/GPAT1-8 HAD-like domain-containing protein n=1 Tax=Coptis chinensis TaxID=261450 RepID=A0A835HXP1_9MAGN|nr:hypothetical protein IFM89_031583 [Coptis chinensis]
MGKSNGIPSPTFPTIDQCASIGREKHTVVADMDGTLLRAGFLYYIVSESAGIQVLVFATYAGMKVSDIESVARAVLPKFYSTDLHPESWRVFHLVESYVVPFQPKVDAVSRDKLPKPIVFHDGRLVTKPSPLMALITILWIPVGFILACLRIAAGSLLPMPLVYYAFWALSVFVFMSKEHPSTTQEIHRPIWCPLHMFSQNLTRSYLPLHSARSSYCCSDLFSLTPFEILSPIKTVRLSRDRERDASMIKKLLEEGDLVICPEGTTCREPFLLRFSALFAELTDQIVPVAMANRMSMFHGTTARGWKGMDPFYFFMNPSPAVIAASLSYECTSFTRKDKYRALAGNDGTVEKAKVSVDKVMGC